MTDRQSITEVWQESDNSFVRMIEANRRQQAIDKAVRLTLAMHGDYIRGWINKPEYWPIIACWVRDKYRSII